MEIKQNDKESKIKVITNKHKNTSNKNFKNIIIIQQKI